MRKKKAALNGLRDDKEEKEEEEEEVEIKEEKKEEEEEIRSTCNWEGKLVGSSGVLGVGGRVNFVKMH